MSSTPGCEFYKTLKLGKEGVEEVWWGGFTFTFITLSGFASFPLICQREREKETFLQQQASIFQYIDGGSLVLIICGILLRDVGLSQVAAYMPISLCCYSDALS